MALMMEAARASETSVDIQLRTRQYIPEDSELQDSIVSIFITTTMALLLIIDVSFLLKVFSKAFEFNYSRHGYSKSKYSVTS
jgi:hypothetical protein